jgi:hypothetical protein
VARQRPEENFMVRLTPENAHIAREYILADAAWEMSYDEMLERRAQYLELYRSVGIELEDDELDEIDNNDVEFWQFHSNICQRLDNAKLAVKKTFDLSSMNEVQTTFSSKYGTETSKVEIDWEAHRYDGLYDKNLASIFQTE